MRDSRTLRPRFAVVVGEPYFDSTARGDLANLGNHYGLLSKSPANEALTRIGPKSAGFLVVFNSDRTRRGGTFDIRSSVQRASLKW